MAEYAFLSGCALVVWWYGKRFRLLRRFADSTSQLGLTRPVTRRVCWQGSKLCLGAVTAYYLMVICSAALPQAVAERVAPFSGLVQAFALGLQVLNTLVVFVLLMRRYDNVLLLLLFLVQESL